MRRLRKDKKTRELAAETHLRTGDLVMPYFVVEGRDKKETIGSMPGIYRLSIENLVKDVKECEGLGIRRVLLFGIPAGKDDLASRAYDKDGIVQQAVRAVKKEVKNVVVMTDVCLCAYTLHGHCGILKKQGSGVKGQVKIDNAATLKALAKIAVSHAEAGADFVAPSAMAKGQVAAIRKALDKDGYNDTKILGYSAKFASNFYGPFREAADSSPKFGDRSTYQLDYANSDKAIEEISDDIKEGADIVMVKPALAYLDIIQKAKERFNIPLAAYNVSGEYAMIKAYCKDSESERDIALEALTAMKRAGAYLIITYHAKEAAVWLGAG